MYFCATFLFSMRHMKLDVTILFNYEKNAPLLVNYK